MKKFNITEIKEETHHKDDFDKVDCETFEIINDEYNDGNPCVIGSYTEIKNVGLPDIIKMVTDGTNYAIYTEQH